MPIYWGNTQITPSGFSKVFIGNKKYYEKSEEPVGLDYFYVERVDNSGATGFIELHTPENISAQPVFEYSKNSKDNWQSYTINTKIQIDEGDKIYFRGDNDHISEPLYSCSLYVSDSNGVIHDINSIKIKVGGKIISLMSKALEEPTTLPNYNYKDLLSNSTTGRIPIVSCSDLKLTTITSQNIYDGFLSGAYITDFPIMPALTLQQSSYRELFYGCDRLSGSFSLSATYLDANALHGAFTDTQITDIYLYGAEYAFGVAYTTSTRLNYHFGTNLNTIRTLASSSRPTDAHYIYFHFTDNDTYSFDASQAVVKGDKKGTSVNNFFTDNTQLKNDLLAQAGQYTVVNVFHLDGSNW